MFTTWCTTILFTRRSNLTKLKSALIEREIIEQTETGFYLADPLFQYWFRQEMM